MVRHGGTWVNDLCVAGLSPSGFLDFIIFLRGMRTGPPPHLEWLSFLPLAAVVLITPNGAELPGSGRIRVIGALSFFSI